MTKLKTKTYKTRAICRHFMEKTENSFSVRARWIVEICIDRRWTPLGTDAGITKFETKEQAEAAAKEATDKLAS